MTDTPTPAIPPAGQKPGLWTRYRHLPMWVQVLVPVVIVALLGIGIWAIAGGGDDETASDTDDMEQVLKGIIVVGGVSTSTTTTTLEETTTTVAETTTTVADATTTVAATTTAAPATTAAPPATTAAPPATTAAPPTTEAPPETTTPPPIVTVPPGQVADSPEAFVAAWNAAAKGTNVPTISTSQVEQIYSGANGDAFLVPLPKVSGTKLPAQVGLIGVVSNDDPRRLAEVLLVWTPGADDTSSEYYWEAFGVLVAAVDPTADAGALAASLGRTDGTPPFPAGTDTSTSSGGFAYRLQAGATSDGREVDLISVSQMS